MVGLGSIAASDRICRVAHGRGLSGCLCEGPSTAHAARVTFSESPLRGKDSDGSGSRRTDVEAALGDGDDGRVLGWDELR